MNKRYVPGRNPNSLANLKKTAGPGRPKMTPEERVIKKAIREYMREYLEDGEAVKDFQRIRARKPDVALKEAMDRIYGRIDKPAGDTGNSRGQINLLVQVLTGKPLQNEMIQTKSNNPVIRDISDSPDRPQLADIERSG